MNKINWNNPEEVRKYNHEKYERNKERVKIKQKEYRQKNKEKIKEMNKRYREENKEKFKESRKIQSKNYYETHKKECNERNIKCRKRRFENDKEFKKSQLERLNNYYKNLSEEVKKEKSYNKSLKCHKKRGDKGIFRMEKDRWLNSTTSEKSAYISKMKMADATANKSQFGERTSKRKGVCFEKDKGKWSAYMKLDGVTYRKRFSTEQEAIEYREYLENKHFTEEQLAMKNKL